jgi:sec-independent protein translocase protein TatA
MLGFFTGFGFWDILIIGFVLLVVFGPKRLPRMGRSMGGAIRGFKDSVTGHIEKQDAEAEQEEAARAELPPGQPAPPVAQPQVDPRERDTVL